MPVSSQKPSNKIVGTSLPMFSLRSKNSRPKADCGTVIDAFPFLDWLAATDQNAWQVLPLSETHWEPGSRSKHVSSPYKGYGIGLDRRFLDGKWAKMEPTESQLADFRQKEGDWIGDYTTFCALRNHFGTDDWTKWPNEGLRLCHDQAVAEWGQAHQEEVRVELLVQWRLKQAFHDLRNRASELKIEKIGDLPYYLPLQSPLVWANQHCFELEAGKMKRVSGIPDGPESHFGRQVWGHPLYNWQDSRSIEAIVGLWRLRLNFYAEFYDIMRLDHAKGFYSYGAISLEGGVDDVVEAGPGEEALEKVIAAGRESGLKIFAEDSGDRISELRNTLRRLEVPGIRILRFAYNEKKKKLETNYSDVANYPANAFAYTSTHDTMTLMAYVEALTEAEKKHLCLHVGVTYTEDEELLANRLRQTVLDSPAAYAIIALQDWLLLPDQINIPGTETATDDPNWRWRMPMPVEELPSRVYGHGSISAE